MEDKIKSFAQYLRQKQGKYVPQEVLEDIPDEDILEAYRTNGNDQKEMYTKEQELAVIMEHDSNEAIFKALEELQHMHHLDEIEKRVTEEFSNLIRPIEVIGGIKKIQKILKSLQQATKSTFGVEDVNKIIKEACSIFPQWILSGEKYFVREFEPHKNTFEAEQYCVGCLLQESLYRMKTLGFWANHTLTGDTDEDEEVELFVEQITGLVVGSIFEKIVETSTDNEIEEKMSNNRLINSLVENLIEKMNDYVLSTSLISCWIHCKDIAQVEVKKGEELEEFMRETHNRFDQRYQRAMAVYEVDNYVQEVSEFLSALPIDRLECIVENDFPVEMSPDTAVKINKILEDLYEKADILP